ncbi:MAG: carbon storage regulator [Planctomycetes bacterium]|jgi:carbon storage regulator|nr:carbon storage regulator [Phycisphaerae bacterium]MBU6209544.1 carbon storage regulator [Planctomycetota bacterium]
MRAVASLGRRSAVLVITRHVGEEVIIGNPAAPLGTIRIAAIKGDRVRIAFDFPREMPVHRSEVAKEILEEQQQRRTDIAGRITEDGTAGA